MLDENGIGKVGEARESQKCKSGDNWNEDFEHLIWCEKMK